MSFNTLLTILTNAGLTGEVLPPAEAMARACDAHLEVMCLGVDRSQAATYYGGATALILKESVETARAEARAIHDAVNDHFKTTDIRWGSDENIAQQVELARVVSMHARFCDLAILPRPYGPERGVELETCVEACLFDAGAPTLILPAGGGELSPPQRIVIAWNESAEALRAVRAALPLMRAAREVHVVIIDPPQHGPGRSDPGGLLSQYLARHGLRVEVDILSRTLPRIADMLVRHVTDLDADMLVMGAYGHSRFREAVFGGATRDLLTEAPVPVFMAH